MTSIPENRKNQKLLKMQRKSKKTPDMDKIIELKKMWEKIRPKNLSKAEKHALITKTFKMVDGNIKSLIFKHDSSRIVQALLKYSDPNLERRHILEQLSGNYVELSQTTYGKFIALKALKYAPNSSERSKIIQEFLNSKLLVKLFQHKFSGQVLDTIFCIYANGKERQRMLQEFYGTEYALTLATGTDDKNVPLSNISEVFAKFPEKKPRILSQMQSVLEGVLKKESIGPNEIIHRVLFDFMSNIELSQVKELVLSETGSFFSILKQIPEIVHTKYGSQIAMIVLGASSAKERKVILKSLKPYVKKIAEDSNGWLVLARVFDCVDDTVLVKNCVLNELVDGKLLPELMTNSNVCNLFLYLLAGQSTKYFSPDLIKILNVSSGFIASTSKKSADARKGELMASVVPRFLSELSGQSSALAAALTNWKSGLLLCELLGSSVAKANAGEANKIVDLMAKLSSSLTEVEVGQDVVVFNQNFPRILKRLLELPSAADVFGQHLLSKGFLERLFENCANSPPEPFYAIGHLVKTLESPQVEEIAKLFTKLCPDAKETQNQGIKKLAEQLKLQVQ